MKTEKTFLIIEVNYSKPIEDLAAKAAARVAMMTNVEDAFGIELKGSIEKLEELNAGITR